MTGRRHRHVADDMSIVDPSFDTFVQRVDRGDTSRMRPQARTLPPGPAAPSARRKRGHSQVVNAVHHLAPAGVAGFVLANGSMSSNQSGGGEIRKKLVEADLVDCIVALPGQLFYSTQIPVCLWFLAKNKTPRPAARGEGGERSEPGEGPRRDRRGQVLFVDARKLGRMVDRTHRELTDDDVARIATTYHAWRGEQSSPSPRVRGEGGERSEPGEGSYADLPGFCKSATLDEIRAHGHVLTPGRYVGAEAQEDDGEPFDAKMRRLVVQLREQQGEAAKLDAAIAANLRELGYGG